MPVRQAVHTLSAVTLQAIPTCCPLGHAVALQEVHTVCPLFAAKFVPDTQSAHVDWPWLPWNLPGTQDTHAPDVVAPSSVDALPVPHWVQEPPVNPLLSWYVPVPHRVHVDPLLYDPTLQL